MSEKPKVAAFIGARLGSERVKCKNLRLVAGKPLIYYSIQELKRARNFDEIYVNSESALIGEVAQRYGIPFYQRPPELATSASRFDQYIYDFITHVPCDVVAVINPTSPFLTAEEMDRAVEQYFASGCDTLLACEAIKTHCFLDGRSINFDVNGLHPRSQDLPPVLAMNYAIAMWNAKKFIQEYEEKGRAVYLGKLEFFLTDGLSTIDIDTPEDFALAALIRQSLEFSQEPEPEYDPVLDDIIASGQQTEC